MVESLPQAQTRRQVNPEGLNSTLMRTTVKRLWLFCYTTQGKRLIRYGMVSGVSVLVSFAVLTLVYGVLQLWTEVPSAFFANIVASVVNYFLNRRWVWGKSGRSNLRREIIPFWILSVSGIVFALLTASFARNFSNAHDLGHWARTVVILGANAFAFGTVWVVKFVVLNRIFQPAAMAKVEADVPKTGLER
jgi:putative flippase GtrA